LPLQRLMIPFQIVAHLLRSSGSAAAFQAMIKRRMIAPQKGLPLTLERRVEAGSDSLEVRDTLTPERALGRLSRLDLASVISMHSPSARQEPALVAHGAADVLSRACELLNLGRAVSLRWRWRAGAAEGVLALADDGGA
jgi:hypothetical protein